MNFWPLMRLVPIPSRASRSSRLGGSDRVRLLGGAVAVRAAAAATRA
jgi:hypothetical protein